MNFKKLTIASAAILSLALSACESSDEQKGASTAKVEKQTLTNVSYDPTRELYANYNEAFASTGKKRPARTWKSRSPMAVPESRRSKWRTVSKPTW